MPLAKGFERETQMRETLFMNVIKCLRATPRTAICGGLALLILFQLDVRRASAQSPDSNQSAAFAGPWCVQGDPTKHASISDNGTFLTLTNESGSTSTGQYQGQTGIVASDWQFVTGNLSPDAFQINWSNGTFWARCSNNGNGGGGGWHRRLNLNGTWYSQGNRSQTCTIRQNGKQLQLNNQSSDNATGRIDGGHHLTTYWNGNRIAGSVTANGNQILWDNGTYWTRLRVFLNTLTKG